MKTCLKFENSPTALNFAKRISALSVSYSVHEAKRFLFQLCAGQFSSWSTKEPINVVNLLLQKCCQMVVVKLAKKVLKFWSLAMPASLLMVAMELSSLVFEVRGPRGGREGIHVPFSPSSVDPAADPVPGLRPCISVLHLLPPWTGSPSPDPFEAWLPIPRLTKLSLAVPAILASLASLCIGDFFTCAIMSMVISLGGSVRDDFLHAAIAEIFCLFFPFNKSSVLFRYLMTSPAVNVLYFFEYI